MPSRFRFRPPLDHTGSQREALPSNTALATSSNSVLMLILTINSTSSCRRCGLLAASSAMGSARITGTSPSTADSAGRVAAFRCSPGSVARRLSWPGSEPVEAARALPLHHAGHRLPRLSALIARAAASAGREIRRHAAQPPPAAFLFICAFLFFDRPVRAGCCRYVLTLGNVSPHLVHSSKSHECARKRMLRWKQAKALTSSTCTLTTGSPSSASAIASL